MTVKFFDGTETQVRNRDEAVKLIKEGLAAWMQDGDRITWAWTNLKLKDINKLPDVAYVVTEHGESTDAYAFIKE